MSQSDLSETMQVASTVPRHAANLLVDETMLSPVPSPLIQPASAHRPMEPFFRKTYWLFFLIV